MFVLQNSCTVLQDDNTVRNTHLEVNMKHQMWE